MKHTVTAIVALQLAQTVFAQDRLVFTSGKQYTCEVLSYQNGQFTVRLDNGELKPAAASSVRSITFARNPHTNTTERLAESPATMPTPAQTAQANFRRAKWGMSKAEVKATEGTPPTKEEDAFLFYSDSLAGLDALVIYVFAGDCLVRAKYSFIDEHTNENDFIYDFESLAENLAKKYGRPKEHDVVWKRDLYRDDRDRWGFAVSHGDLLYSERWESPDTEIFHLLSGDNFRIRHVVEYTSKLLGSLEDVEKQRADQGKL